MTTNKYLFFQQGCREALQAHVHDYINIIAGIGIGIAIVEV